MAELVNSMIENVEALVVALLGLVALYQKVRRAIEGRTLESVIRGVERGTTRLDPDQAKAFKREIQTEAAAAKVEDFLRAKVEQAAKLKKAQKE